MFSDWFSQCLFNFNTENRTIISSPANGRIIVAPKIKKPIANVRQIMDKNPKKIKFSFIEED